MDWQHLPRDVARVIRTVPTSLCSRYLPIRRGAPHTLPGRLVLSLTSYPARYPTLDLTLRRLLNQDMSPDQLVLWIAHEDRAALPRRVESLQEHGLVIRECTDLKSYNKIIHALSAYPDAYIAICDDDMAYPRDWLRHLIQEYRHPDEAVAQHAKRFTLGADGWPIPYAEWPSVRVGERASALVQPMGSGGVLYPPGFFPERTTDAGELMRLCPKADDIWLYWMFAGSGRTARKIKAAKVLHCPGTQTVGLKHENDFGGGNDRQIAALFQELGLPWGAPASPAGGPSAPTIGMAPETAIISCGRSHHASPVGMPVSVFK